MISHEQILRCVEYAKEARALHLQWEQHPLAASVESSLVGNAEWHRKWVLRYDEILAVLQHLATGAF